MRSTHPVRERESTTGRPQKSPFTRQRLGCLTCRRRKKKCDMTYPVCGHCTRLNLACNREVPRELASGSTADSSALRQATAPHSIHGSGSAEGPELAGSPPTTSASIHLGNVLSHSKIWQTLDPSVIHGGELAASRRSMLRYYIQIFAFMLTTNVENNCFLTVLLPMSFESPALMKALAAWSSSHLALRNQAFTDVALQHRGSALRNFKVAMEDEDLSTEVALAATLVFCSLDVISDGTGSWYHHLRGGAALLISNQRESGITPAISPSSKTMEQLQSYEGKWLLKNFAYHDILASITMNTRPLLGGEYWISSGDDSAADPYFGLAERILHLIAEISHLNAEMTEAKQLEATPEALANTITSFSSRARAIEDELREWKCPSAGFSPALVSLAQAYRSAARIHLYRTIRAHIPDAAEHTHSKIQSQVKSIAEAVGNIPEGCLPECTLLFPVFMAGGDAEDSRDIWIIRNKLESMNRWRCFRNVEAALDVLDELWRLNATRAGGESGDRIDWLDVIKRRGWKLAIS
ncbi:unnamed protein product [Clonostachys byssicola]|uniref:Zn(2)-C6 fungal-type domain-containing protein n=1 Tax=Clonostachys byssicola TaxID=160290 RepID=A0A9N9U9S8_9HYPO|nr:unnamed protein product [Clonostachys byssicola]